MTTSDDHSTAHDLDIENETTAASRLGRFLFDLQADQYDATDPMRELAWADDRIQAFWHAQADAVVGFLCLDRCR
jgi:hypothetical protein